MDKVKSINENNIPKEEKQKEFYEWLNSFKKIYIMYSGGKDTWIDSRSKIIRLKQLFAISYDAMPWSMVSEPLNTALYEANIVVKMIARIKIAIKISSNVKPVSCCLLLEAGRLLEQS